MLKYVGTLLFFLSIVSCGTAQDTPPMKARETNEIVSIADTFKLADDVLIPYRVGDKFGFCDKDKNIVIEPQYIMATPFSNGYAGVVIRPEDALQNLAGYINRDGEMITGFEYSFVNPFQKNGRAVVRNLGSQYGVINTEGEYIIPPVFDKISYYEDFDLYLVEDDGKEGLIDENNNVRLPIECETIFMSEDHDLIRVKKGGKWGFYDGELNLIIPFEYDKLYASAESDKLFFAQIGDEKFLMDKEQREIVDLRAYKKATYFNENIAVVIKGSGYFDNKWGMIELPSGKEIFPCEYSVIKGAKCGILTIQIEHDSGKDKYGLINDRGDFVIEPIYDFMIVFDRDFIRSDIGMRYVVFDAEGDQIFESKNAPGVLGDMRKTGLYTLSNLQAEPDLYGVVDRKGNIILEVIYESIDADGFDKNGLIRVKSNNKYYYMDMDGEEYIKD